MPSLTLNLTTFDFPRSQCAFLTIYAVPGMWQVSMTLEITGLTMASWKDGMAY